jgi:hypothetical protein
MKASSLVENGTTASKSTAMTKGAAKGARRRVADKPSASKTSNPRAKSETLTCRYCGSSDLAPSFVKRRDRRCRKCFSQRYASKPSTKAAKSTKK